MVEKVFPGRFESLTGISLFIKDAISRIGFSEFEQYAIETAVDEACSNIIEHAYKGMNDGSIDCFVIPSADRVEIILKDSGRPFDPQKVKPPNINCPLPARKNHGLGLYFIYKCMDEVEYKREGSVNCNPHGKGKESSPRWVIPIIRR